MTHGIFYLAIFLVSIILAPSLRPRTRLRLTIGDLTVEGQTMDDIKKLMAPSQRRMRLDVTGWWGRTVQWLRGNPAIDDADCEKIGEQALLGLYAHRREQAEMLAAAHPVFVTSLAGHGRKARRVFQVSPTLAGQLLVNATHRRSTPREIARWKEEQHQPAPKLRTANVKPKAQEPPPEANKKKKQYRGKVIGDDLIPGLKLAVFAEDQPEYTRLPAILSRAESGRATTRWHLTFRERWKLFWGGDLFLQMLTFQGPLMPVRLSVDEPTAEECL